MLDSRLSFLGCFFFFCLFNGNHYGGGVDYTLKIQENKKWKKR